MENRLSLQCKESEVLGFLMVSPPYSEGDRAAGQRGQSFELEK
jgi:hypothetical protein